MTENTFRESCSSISCVLRERAYRAEQERRISEESIHDLRKIGTFRKFTPLRYGGDEGSLVPIFDGFIELAQSCASTAWVASLLSLHNFLLATFHTRAQEEVWSAGPDSLVAASVAPAGQALRVPGGFTLRGNWQFASGVDHCAWAIVTSLLPDERDKPDAWLFLVPATEYQILDDWQVAGLRATGSKSIAIERDIFVPQYRGEALRSITPSIARGMHVNDHSWHRRIPWQPLFSYGLVPAAIGNALAMLACFRDYIGQRRSRYSGQPFRDRPMSLVRLAHAHADINVARLLLRCDLEELELCAKAGDEVPAASIERMLFNVAYIVQCCSEAVDRLYQCSGGHALYDTNPLQRFFRDTHAITQHAVLDMDMASERFGKFILTQPKASNHV